MLLVVVAGPSLGTYVDTLQTVLNTDVKRTDTEQITSSLNADQVIDLPDPQWPSPNPQSCYPINEEEWRCGPEARLPIWEEVVILFPPPKCVPTTPGGEMITVHHPGFIVGAELIKENGCVREHWEYVEYCPLIPNPDWTPPELRGFESEPDPYPQPEFIGDYECQKVNPIIGGFELKWTEELSP